MTSIATQNLSTAAAATDVAQPVRISEAQKQTPPSINAQNPQQRSQSAQAAVIFAKNDKDRSPYTPKQVDASFSSQEEHDTEKDGTKTKNKRSNSNQDKINLVA